MISGFVMLVPIISIAAVSGGQSAQVLGKARHKSVDIGRKEEDKLTGMQAHTAIRML
jgi:hypothetical protein